MTAWVNGGVARRLPMIAYTSFLLLTIALMVASFPAGVYTVYFTQISNHSLGYMTRTHGIGVFIGPYSVGLPLSVSLGSLFLGLTVVYVAFFALAAVQTRNIFSATRDSLASGSFDALLSNPLAATTMSLGATVFIVGVISLVQESVGIPTGSIGGDPLDVFVSVTLAPLREEFGFRLVFIGGLAFALSLGSSVRTAFKALWRPSAILVGGADDLAKRTALYAMMSVSAILFGATHYFSGAGWEIGKVSQAAFAGFVLGYLYIRYGFHAAVLLHWGVNYFGTVYAFFGQGVWGIPWTSETGNVLSLLTEVDLLLLIGVTSAALFGFRTLRRRHTPVAHSGLNEIT